MKKWFMVLFLLVLATGCDQQSQQTLPTIAPSFTPLPATEVQLTAEATVAPTEPAERPTLPAAWTSSPVPSPTPVTPTATVPGQQLLPTLVVCGNFKVDPTQNSTTFALGTAPQVYWTAVPTAGRYRIGLIDDKGDEIFMDYTLDNTYVFRADLFEKGKRYAWEVYPEDSLNQQMCLIKVGLELFPQ